MSHIQSEAKARADAALIQFFSAEIPTLLNMRRNEIDRGGRLASFDDKTLSALTAHLQQSANDYMKGGFLRSIHNLYSSEERAFISRIAAQFERVALGFAYFSLFSHHQRPFEALRLTQHQPRTGWQRTGIPLAFNQSVDDHHRNGTTLAIILFPENPEVARRFPYHDVGEAVIGDFTPHDPISKQDKVRIEKLGIRLLCAYAAMRGNSMAQLIQDTFDIYDGEAPQHQNLRSQIKDCDLLEMAYEMVFVMEQCPASEKIGIIANFQEFWDYIGPHLESIRAQKMFEVLQTARHGSSCSGIALLEKAANHIYADDPQAERLLAIIEQHGHEHMQHTRADRPSMDQFKDLPAFLRRLAVKTAP